ncbi:MAG: hypothetical protein WA361_09020 [Candidatus Acidiferrales bacterium]
MEKCGSLPPLSPGWAYLASLAVNVPGEASLATFTLVAHNGSWDGGSKPPALPELLVGG